MSIYLYYTQEMIDALIAAGVAHTKDDHYYIENVEIRLIPPFKEPDTLRGHRLTDEEARTLEEVGRGLPTAEQLAAIDIFLEKTIKFIEGNIR